MAPIDWLLDTINSLARGTLSLSCVPVLDVFAVRSRRCDVRLLFFLSLFYFVISHEVGVPEHPTISVVTFCFFYLLTKQKPMKCRCPVKSCIPIGCTLCNINRTSPRIVNIVENQVLVYYNAERFLQYLGSISEL